MKFVRRGSPVRDVVVQSIPSSSSPPSLMLLLQLVVFFLLLLLSYVPLSSSFLSTTTTTTTIPHPSSHRTKTNHCSESYFHTTASSIQQRLLQQRRRRFFPWSSSCSSAETVSALRMVRNIDLVETLIFYGHDSCTVSATTSSDSIPLDQCNDIRPTATTITTAILMPGVQSLIDECTRDGTAVVAIVDPSKVHTIQRVFENTVVVVHNETSPPPNPKDLYTIIQSIEIQPYGFGGSSGFGRKNADPPRNPLPQHCVVLCTTTDQCRAARYMGMRVVCLRNDNLLADAIIDDEVHYWESIGMDDIATPGSFWLNPPHPRDDDGNKVDPVSIIEGYGQRRTTTKTTTVMTKKQQQQQQSLTLLNDDIIVDVNVNEEDRRMDEYLASILNDIDPL
jgi:hypothetical protein